MGRIAAASVLIIILTCGCGPGQSEVETYGVENFRRDIFDPAGRERILAEVGGREIRPYLTGRLLVVSESSRSLAGIYVDPKSLDRLGGSGFEVDEWYPDLGFVKIKIRQTAP